MTGAREKILQYLDGPRVSLGDMRAGDMSLDQLDHYRANRRAMENAGPPPPLEYEQRELTIEERLYRTAEVFRTWCDDEDAIATDLAWKLVRHGFSTDEAEEVLGRVGITWTARKVS
jgi:hypothetical protein